jgi:two-component system nitrogen regulation sensor histidine kinase GlnL
VTEAQLSLEPFLSQVRYASAIFGPNGALLNSSPKFATLFAPEKERTSYDTLFATAPLLTDRITQVYAEKTPFYLYDTKVLIDPAESPFNAEIFPLIDAEKEFHGVAVNLFETQTHSIFSEQKKRHDALSRVGLIANGLAHEIKNPLSGLKGAAQLILDDVEQTSSLADYARIIAKESERINRLVEELLDFTRPKELKFAKINIHKVLHDVIETQKFAARDKAFFIPVDRG